MNKDAKNRLEHGCGCIMVLTVEEIGYLPLEHVAATMLFHRVSA